MNQNIEQNNDLNNTDISNQPQINETYNNLSTQPNLSSPNYQSSLNVNQNNNPNMDLNKENNQNVLTINNVQRTTINNNLNTNNNNFNQPQINETPDNLSTQPNLSSPNYQFNLGTNQISNTNMNLDKTNNQNITNSNSSQGKIVNNNEKNNKYFSKASKIMMILVLISSLIIILDRLVLGMDWYWNLKIIAAFAHDEKTYNHLEMIDKSIKTFNLIVVLIITIISIVFLIKDKKQKKDTSVFEWYIITGLLHIFIGTIGFTSLLYSLSTLIISITHKKSFTTSNKKYVIISIIITLIVVLITILNTTNLSYKIEDNVDKYKESQKNKEKTIKDSDTTHIITTFDNIISDWGDDVTKNKSYKIQNVKLNNITASLYIDYIYNEIGDNPSSTIILKHGDNELYHFTDNILNFNISYIYLYDNFILYSDSYCDSIKDGICEKHPTHYHTLAFTEDNYVTFYDSLGSNYGNYSNTNYSVFEEDKEIYSIPYNDFRVYNIEVKDEYIYFYTVIEDYKDIFSKDKLKYKECSNPLWVTSTFDMQRVYKAKIIYDESYKYYKINSLAKQSSIKYEDYCKNENILNI